MRKARYDLQQVLCRHSSTLGHSTCIAKPGYWITTAFSTARVLGRIAEPYECKGWLAVVSLHTGHRSAGIRWLDPKEVTACYAQPPQQLLAWITGPDWVKNKSGIARIIAMSEHGTLQEQFIATRDDPEKAYNCRPEYAQQFILKG